MSPAPSSRPDLSALSRDDRAWLDELGLALLRRDDVSGETAGRVMGAHRQAVLALRADEVADGRDHESLREAFGTPESVVRGLVAIHPDDDAVDAEDRQTATVLAQCSGVAVMVGIYLVLVWPLQHVLSDSADAFGLPQVILFGGLVAAVGGFWSAIRSYGFGDLGTAARGALTFAVGVAAVLGAHLVPGPEGPWWWGMLAGVAIVVAGWHLVDAGGAPAVSAMSPERWYRTLRTRLAVVHLLPRHLRDRVTAEARELAGQDPAGELGPVSTWARRAVEADPVAARSSHRNLAVGWTLLAFLAGALAVVSVASEGGAWTAAVWAAFLVLCVLTVRSEQRRARASS